MDNNVRIKNITDKSVLTLEGEDGIHLIGKHLILRTVFTSINKQKVIQQQ